MPKKKSYRIRNWSEYNKALVNRGSLTVWFDAESIAAWHNTDLTGKRGRPYLQKYLKINPSAQYLVARNGQIYQLIPDDRIAVHVIGLNYMAIQYLVGHYEYQCFRKAPLWKEHNPNYLTGKVDPGPKFMQAVRQQVAGLDLKGCP